MSDENAQLTAKTASRCSLTRTIVRVLTAVAALALLAWLLCACGTPSGQATVSGTVAFQQMAEPAPGAILIVQIQDISRADAPAVVVGEQTIPKPEAVPVPFAVTYDPAAIDESHEYIVHARVEDESGNLLYTTMQNYAVITFGHPTENVQIVLEVVGGTTPLL